MKSFDLQMLDQIFLKYRTGQTKHSVVQTWPPNEPLLPLLCGYVPVPDKFVLPGGGGWRQKD